MICATLGWRGGVLKTDFDNNIFVSDEKRDATSLHRRHLLESHVTNNLRAAQLVAISIEPTKKKLWQRRRILREGLAHIQGVSVGSRRDHAPAIDGAPFISVLPVERYEMRRKGKIQKVNNSLSAPSSENSLRLSFLPPHSTVKVETNFYSNS